MAAAGEGQKREDGPGCGGRHAVTTYNADRPCALTDILLNKALRFFTAIAIEHLQNVSWIFRWTYSTDVFRMFTVSVPRQTNFFITSTTKYSVVL